jgi:hypothetical protein
MLTAIQLNDQPHGPSDEIADEWANWDLPIETRAADLTIAQDTPKAALCLRRVVPELP